MFFILGKGIVQNFVLEAPRISIAGNNMSIMYFVRLDYAQLLF